MKQHPLEALLRPPIELWSAVCALGCAVIALIAPSTLLMTPTVGMGTAVLLIALGGLRSVQALHILRYQRSMHTQSRYQLKPSAIPVNDTRLFLGQGFQWTQCHTQRLRDTLNPRVQHYLQSRLLHRLARTIESRCETIVLLGWLVYLLNRDAWWNPVRPQLDLGGKSMVVDSGS